MKYNDCLRLINLLSVVHSQVFDCEVPLFSVVNDLLVIVLLQVVNLLSAFLFFPTIFVALNFYDRVDPLFLLLELCRLHAVLSLSYLRLHRQVS